MQIKINRARQEFLGRFKLDNRVLQKGDVKSGRAKMTGGHDRDSGERVIVKQWKRDSVVTEDVLKEIWRQEIRQLHRLAGCPGARDFIVAHSDSGEDLDGFYLILCPDQRLPLESIIDRSSDFHWLKQPKLPVNRLRLWGNLRRVATGLDILHAQGLLHRNLDSWAIFTSGGDELDFQLSGFEWSVRLTGVTGRQNDRIRKFAKEDSAVYSFLEDWRAFGRLAAQLLGIDLKVLLGGKKRDDISDSSTYITAAERALLQLLLRSDPMSRIDGELVEKKIDAISQSLRSSARNRLTTLHLTCNLAAGMRLAQSIYDSTGGDIDLNEIDELQQFILDDISSDPLLILASSPNKLDTRYLLAGRILTYSLSAYQSPKRTEPTWALAYCMAATQRPDPREIVAQQSLSHLDIQLIPLAHVARSFPSLQGRTLHWDQQIEKKAASDKDDASTKQYQGLLLLQLLETLLSAADIFPVEVVESNLTNDGVRIGVSSRLDENRESLSSVLGLRTPALRMSEIFTEERVSLEGFWKISDVGILGNSDDETARWRFIETQEGHDVHTIFFEGPGPRPLEEMLFLRKNDYIGNETSLRRRIKALRALKEHPELLEMLADPRRKIRKTHETIEEDDEFWKLDESKRAALREMWALLPLFLVQGPPGVGKTRLVTELVGRSLRTDSSCRILLSAQSHHAVDHLLDEVRKTITQDDGGDQPLMVRSRAKDSDVPEDAFDLRRQAQSVINRLMESASVCSAPEKMRMKLEALQSTYDETSLEQKKLKINRKRDRSFEALLLRSANVVFATTNSGDIERLIEERAQFDWTIVEEAAKATGVELIPPLLLSHRRLMIGDHQQLPPYGEEQLRRLLQDPNKVQKALEVGRSLVSRQLRDSALEELFNDPLEIEELQTVCGEAASAITMFETLVKNEMSFTKPGRHRIPIARQLTYQHRMHPAIARLVSAGFYDRALLTDEECSVRFLSSSPPFTVLDSARLPASPIIFVNMPFGQGTINGSVSEKQPNYHNPDEVDAVIEVLSLIDVNVGIAEKASIAVLSPYRQQVRHLNNRIKKEIHGKLKHISGFTFEGDAETPAGTVDSFQGSEADIVVLSLVRNNHHSGKRALGFLSDSRRMNVLLSRAKWKLIIVGCLPFLEKRLPSEKISKSDPLYFLSMILDMLETLQNETSVDGIPLATVIDVNTLNGSLR